MEGTILLEMYSERCDLSREFTCIKGGSSSSQYKKTFRHESLISPLVRWELILEVEAQLRLLEL